MATQLGTLLSVPGLRRRHPQNHLHDQRHRVVELPAPQGHQNRGHFPTEDAVLKILYLAIRNIGNNRGGELGTGTQGWKQALNAFAIAFPGRLDPTT